MNLKSYLSLITLTTLLFFSCAEKTSKSHSKEQEITPQKEFFNHFKLLEGKKFAGKEVFIAEGIDSWANLELEMYVREFADTIVYIPFRVGENTSRTWMLIMEGENTLRFRHDHRHDDGTPEDLNLYGGYGTNEGSAYRQVFPADDFTCQMLERICDNEWTVEFSEDISTYSYSLRKAGVLIIQIDFDLNNPIE
jgi:hypothetical protein